MRNVILTVFSAFLLLTGASASAQILTSNGNKDTAGRNYDGSAQFYVHNDIKSGSAAPVFLRWHVVNSYFGPGWEIVQSGFCDNISCRSALTPTGNIFTDHTVEMSDAYTNAGYNDFKMLFNTSNPAMGSYSWVQIFAEDTVGGTSRTLNYFAYMTPAGVSTTVTSDEVLLFPNPAREAVNVVFDSKAGVKTIAVYNLIGKLVGPIYKPSNNSSAKIDLNDIPNGVYFMRLMNAQGEVVSTRRFIRQ
jgi:hypothetical protein